MDSTQQTDIIHLTLGMKAPDFQALTTFGPVRMSDYKGKWLIFFSHPGDYTPVCTTEFLALANMYPSFKAINTELLGLSIDSNPSHLAWVYSIYLENGIEIPFPVVADRIGDIARLYGMIAPDITTQSTVRDVFIIDPDQTIRAILIYPMTNGRSTGEMFRLVKALQVTDEYKALTPANWTPNNPVLVPVPRTYQELLERENNAEEMNLSCVDWFWCYKDIPQENKLEQKP